MKEILERNGFIYQGFCKICSGRAELFTKGEIKCKVRARQMKFILSINGKQIFGKANELESALERFIPKETTL